MFLTSLKLTHGGRCLQQAVGASSSGRARRGYRLHRPSCSYSPQQQGEPAAAAAADQGGAGCSGEPPAEAGKVSQKMRSQPLFSVCVTHLKCLQGVLP